MADLAYNAMLFALRAHADQKRKYTDAPYSSHLAEVAGIVSTVATLDRGEWVRPDEMIAVAWLHDCIEDQNVSADTLRREFGVAVMSGVLLLSDLEEGNRAERKAASRRRLAAAPGWVQTIKCADLISNTGSIVQYDPKFAVTYLEEKQLLLDVMRNADQRLWQMANQLAYQQLPMTGIA